jgi:hypothetical protein
LSTELHAIHVVVIPPILKSQYTEPDVRVLVLMFKRLIDPLSKIESCNYLIMSLRIASDKLPYMERRTSRIDPHQIEYMANSISAVFYKEPEKWKVLFDELLMQLTVPEFIVNNIRLSSIQYRLAYNLTYIVSQGNQGVNLGQYTFVDIIQAIPQDIVVVSSNMIIFSAIALSYMSPYEKLETFHNRILEDNEQETVNNLSEYTISEYIREICERR